MKFKRTTLINTINEQVVRAYADAQKVFEEDLRKYEEAETKWLCSEHREYFIDVGEALGKKARSAEVITREDLKPFQIDWSSNARNHVFNFTFPVLREPDVSALQNLASFLETIADDEVSSSGLRDVGFRNIAQILRNDS